MNIKYSLVIPCFNEEKSLEVLLPQLVIVIERVKNDVEFILVNNGSTDRTIEILSKLSSKNITIVSLDKNVGYGGGIKAGLLKCKGDFIGWIHADLQYSIFEVIAELGKIDSKT